jgi:hypothetical protein
LNAVFRGVGISAGSAVTADAPPASDNDNPAAPNTGTAFLARFRFKPCFAYDMTETSRIASIRAVSNRRERFLVPAPYDKRKITFVSETD